LSIESKEKFQGESVSFSSIVSESRWKPHTPALDKAAILNHPLAGNGKPIDGAKALCHFLM
jgi:hypothetical protein